MTRQTNNPYTTLEKILLVVSMFLLTLLIIAKESRKVEVVEKQVFVFDTLNNKKLKKYELIVDSLKESNKLLKNKVSSQTIKINEIINRKGKNDTLIKYSTDAELLRIFSKFDSIYYKRRK